MGRNRAVTKLTEKLAFEREVSDTVLRAFLQVRNDLRIKMRERIAALDALESAQVETIEALRALEKAAAERLTTLGRWERILRDLLKEETDHEAVLKRLIATQKQLKEALAITTTETETPYTTAGESKARDPPSNTD